MAHATRHCGDGVGGSERKKEGSDDVEAIVPCPADADDGRCQRGAHVADRRADPAGYHERDPAVGVCAAAGVLIHHQLRQRRRRHNHADAGGLHVETGRRN